MDQEIKAEEIQEVLNYISQIKNYEVATQQRIDTSVSLVWGILLVIAGIVDFMINYVGSPTIASLIWFIVILGGMVYSFLIMRYFGSSYVTEAGKKSLEESRTSFSMMMYIMLATSLITVFILINIAIWNSDLTTPLVTFVVGSVFLFLDMRSRGTEHEGIGGKYTRYLVWIIPYAASGLSLGLYFLIGKEVVKFFGLIMGIAVGGINFINFAETVISEGEMATKFDEK